MTGSCSCTGGHGYKSTSLSIVCYVLNSDLTERYNSNDLKVHHAIYLLHCGIYTTRDSNTFSAVSHSHSILPVSVIRAWQWMTGPPH